MRFLDSGWWDPQLFWALINFLVVLFLGLVECQICQPKILRRTLYKSLELSLLLLHILATLAFPNPLFLSPQIFEIASWCLESFVLIHCPGSKLGQTQCSLSFSSSRIHSLYTPCCPLLENDYFLYFVCFLVVHSKKMNPDCLIPK